MSNWREEDLQRVLAEVARRSAVDPQFRSLTLRDAAAAIAMISPRVLPKDLIFKFVDNSGPIKTIPLPDPETSDCDELAEYELEKVAGGGDPPPPPPLTGG